MDHGLDSWDPRRDAFNDKSFNSYAPSGPTRFLPGRTIGNSKNTTLYVTGIPLELTEAGLLNLFSRSGKVKHAKICEPGPGKERNTRDTFGFVTMESIGDAERAIRDMHHFQLEGFQFKVKMALTEEQKARRKEEQLEMQNMFFNKDDDFDQDDDSLYQSNYKENQSFMNSHGDHHVEPTKGMGRGHVLAEITGLSGGFRSISPRGSGRGMVPAGQGAPNTFVQAPFNKRGLLPHPSNKGPMDNLSITVDVDNRRNPSLLGEAPMPNHLNKDLRVFATGAIQGLNQSYVGQDRGMPSGQYGANNMCSSYPSGPSGYVGGSSLPGSYPHQQKSYQTGPNPQHQTMPSMSAQNSMNTLLQTATQLKSPLIREPPKYQMKERPVKPKVEVIMHECTYCGKLGGQLCSKCKSPYCSRECQAADWPEHKHICGSIEKEKEVADAFESKFDVSVGDELIPKVKVLMEQATGGEIKVTKKETKQDTNGRSGYHSDRYDGPKRSSNNSNNRGKGSNAGNEKGPRQDCRGYETDVEKRGRKNDQQGTGYETDVGKRKRVCFNCGEEDHTRPNCPKPNGANLECYNCRKVGHVSKECPLKQDQNTGKRQPYQQTRSTKENSPKGFSKLNGDENWDQQEEPKSKLGKQPSPPLAHSTPVDKAVITQGRNRGPDKAVITQGRNRGPDKAVITQGRNRGPDKAVITQGRNRGPAKSDMDTPSRQYKVMTNQGHSLIPNAELPLNKEVTVVVTDPVSVKEIWLQDLEQAMPLQDTMMAMGNKFGQCPCDVTLSNVRVGDYYGAKFIDGAWYRVSVKEVLGQGEVKVHYIDFGNTEVTKVDNLRQLEDGMREQSAKAICCSIGGIDSKTSAMVDQKILKKHVIADVSYTVLCKNVIQGTDQKIFELSSMTSGKGVNVLEGLLSEIKQTADTGGRTSVVLMKDIPHVATRLQTGQQYPVIFSFVNSPNQFTVQVVDPENLNEFGEFDNKLQEFYNQQSHEQYRPTVKEEIIISKYSEDKRWYRAEVIDIHDNEVDVVFIDFGNSETTGFDSCRKITPEFASVERKSLLCCLHKVTVPSPCPPEIVNLYQHFSSNLVMVKVMEVKNNVYAVELYSTEGKSYSENFRSLVNQTDKSDVPVSTPPSDKSEKRENVASSPNDTHPNIVFGELKINTEVEVIPIDILSLRFFHVKISSIELDKQLASLMLELNQDCSTTKGYEPNVEEFVAAQFYDGEQTLWYRGQVLEVTGDGYRVKYVDYGNMSLVKKEAIAKLDPNLCLFPTMAIPCALVGAKTVANNETLLNSFKNVLNTSVIVKAVRCNNGIYEVEMSLPGGVNLNSMLTSAISEMEGSSQGAGHLPSSRDGNVQDEAPKEASSSPGPAQRQREKAKTNTAEALKATFPSKRDDSEKLMEKSNRLMQTTLSEDSLTAVLTVHINSLSSFYVQRSDLESGTALLEMMKDLNEYCTQQNDPYTCQVMEYVAALYDEGSAKCWYRAEVLRIDGASAEVLFIDYGNKDRVKMNDVRPLAPRFLELPIMAVHCSLAGSDGTEPEATTKEFHSILNHKVNLKVMTKFGNQYSVEMILMNPEKTVVNSLFELDASKVSVPLQSTSQPSVDGEKENVLQSSTQGDTSDALHKGQEPSTQPPQVTSNRAEKTFPKPPISVFQLGIPLSAAPMSIDSVHCFYIMLGDMTVQRLLGELMMELNKECSRTSDNYTPSIGEYVAAFFSENGTDEMWYRGLVTDSCENEQYRVHYIDYGNSAVVGTRDIKRLDKQFLELPAFVTCCKLSGCDKVSEEGARQFKTYEGVAVTIQAEREVDGVYEVLMFNQDNHNVKDLILDVSTQRNSGAIPKSREQIDQLPCSATLGPSVLTQPMPTLSPTSTQRTVVFSETVSRSRPKGKELEVVITSPLRPDLFHCQVKDQSNVVALKYLSDSMKVYCEEGPHDGIGNQFKKGELCCAKFIDNDWYRATILDEFPDNTVSVEYVDFGNRHTVNRNQLRPIKPEYTELPLLAFKCTLHGVIPTGTSWCDKAVAEFCKFAEKILSAKLISNDGDVFELDLTDESGVNIAQHLIDAGVAKKEKEEAVDDRELMRRENELLRKQLEQMQSQFATLIKMNQPK